MGYQAVQREEGGALLPESEMQSVGDDAIPLDAWSAVSVAQRTPMQRAIWVQAAFETLYRNTAPEVILQEEDGETSALAAFGRRGAYPQRLMLAGAEEIGEPVDVLYRDDAAADRLAEKVLNRKKPIRFGHYPATSPFVEALRVRSKKKGILLSAPINGSPYIDLDESWITPEQKFNSRRRSDLRRMTRKAEAFGAVAFDVISPRPEDVDRLLDEAIAVEAESWKSRSKTALAYNQEQEAFFRRFARLASEEGILRICLMKIADDIAAMQIAVECDGAFWLFKIGYDEKYAGCSPGNLLMLETVRYAANQELSRYEFLGKSASWTSVWTEKEHPNIRLRYYPHGIEGYAALAIDMLTVGAGRAKTFVQSLQGKRTP